MTASLFRQEAVDHHRNKLLGDVALPRSVPVQAMVVFVLASVAAIAVFLGTHSYARKETVTGFLVPSRGVAKIMPPRPGTVVAVHVREGERVEAGQPLLTVRVEQATDSGEKVDSGILETLRRQRSALLDQAEVEDARVRAARARLDDQVVGLGSELAALDTELATQRTRTKVALAQVTSARDIVKKGYVSQIEFDRRQENYLAQEQSVSGLTRQIAAKRGELMQTRHALEQLPIESAGKLAALRASVADIDAKLTETEGRRAYLLSAPVAGRVSALQASVGRPAQPAVPQLSITPEGDELRAELLVPARAIGFVAPDQTVKIAYDAFPFQRFGLHAGSVLTVSRTLLKPDEVVGPVTVKRPPTG